MDSAAAVIAGFWRNYDSLRWVGDTLILRLRAEPTDAQLDDLNDRFSGMLADGRIERAVPRQPEVADDDVLHLPRLALHLDQRQVGNLFRIIAAVNEWGTAPEL